MYCFVCMECCQGSSSHKREGNRDCFPKASAKVKQILKPTNYLQDFFQKSREKINYAVFTCAIITTYCQKLQNQQNLKLYCFFKNAYYKKGDLSGAHQLCIAIARLKYALFFKNKNNSTFFLWKMQNLSFFSNSSQKK